MIKDIVIYGAGGLGKEIQHLVENINQEKKRFNLIGYLDDDSEKKEWADLPIIGDHHYLNNHSVDVIVAFGNPKNKSEIVSLISQKAKSFPILIHPSAVLMKKASIKIGAGSIISAGTVLTTDIRLKEHVLVNLNSTIGHDVLIERYCSVMCGVNIAGHVQLEEGALIGSGANLINGITVGSDATVGAGSMVNKSVEAGVKVGGIPSRVL